MEMAVAGTTPALAIRNQGALTLTSTALISNGTLELDAGGQLNMSSGGALGTVLAVGTSTGHLSLLTNWAVPDKATVQVSSGAGLNSTSYMDVGSTSNGTLVVDGSGSSATIGSGTAAFSDWGTIGGSATVTFSTSATGNYKSALHIANTGGTAHVNINTGAKLTVSNGLLVGGGATSAATLTLNSATLAIGSGGSANFGSGSTFNFQSGTLQQGGNATFSTGSTLNWSGGTLTSDGETLGIAGGVASLTVGGIGINGETLSITNGGHFDSSDYVDIGTFEVGTMLVSGTGSRITSKLHLSDWGFDASSFATITFSSNGVGTFSNGVSIAASNGIANVNINSGAVVNIAGGLQSTNSVAGSNATITLNNGTLNSTGTTAFFRGTTFTADAFSHLNLGDNATFASGSTVNLTATALTLASGKTLTVDGGVVTDTRNGLIGSGETYIIQNGGHWDSTQEDLKGGTFTVTGSGSRFTSSGSQLSEWFGPGLNVNITNSGTASIAGGVEFGGGSFTSQLNIGTASTGTFGGLNAEANDTENGVTGATTISVNSFGAQLTVTGSAQFGNGVVVNQNDFDTMNLLGNTTFSTGSSFNSSGIYTLNTGSLSTIAFDGGAGTFTNAYAVANGNTLRVTNAGKFTCTQNVDVANGKSTGTLLVDGTNSTFSAGNILNRSQWGINTGNVATVTFSTNAVGSFTPGVIMSSNGGTTNFNILTGAKVTMGDLSVGSATTSSRGFITITSGTLNVTSDAILNHGSDLEFNSGSLNIGGTLTMADDAFAESAAPLVHLGGLSMTGTSKLNLEGGKMIVASTPLATIKGYITTGYKAGAWNGNAIFSSTARASGGIGAIGYATASSIGVGSFGGQSVNPSDTLIRYTYYGDANLDGKVNLLDLNAVATNFGNSSKVWSDGDSNFDGTVNIQDFNALAGNFGATALSSPPVLGALVPEPGCIAGIGIIGLLARRRRKA
jgi:hypothetical protein